jgi:hypothetical protein
MAGGEAEKASASSAMRPASALQHSKCRELEPTAQGRYWMARCRHLFSVALVLLCHKRSLALALPQQGHCPSREISMQLSLCRSVVIE